MTVCIAAITKEGLIVSAKDRKISTGYYSSDSLVHKSYLFHDEWSAMFAGDDISLCGLVMEKVNGNLRGRDNTLEIVIAGFKKAYQEQLSDHAADLVLGRYKLGMDEFLAEGRNRFTAEIFTGLCERIEKVKLGCEFLISGFDSNQQPHIFVISDPGAIKVYDKLGFWAIGMGADAALSMLFFRGQNLLCPMAETVYHICEAKFMAESATDVGKDTFFFIEKYGCDHTLEHTGGIFERIRKVWDDAGLPRIPPGIMKEIREAKFSWTEKKEEGEQ